MWFVLTADACPNTPGVESNNGCPFEALELVDLLSEHIYFNLDGYDFTQDSNFTLMKIIEFVKQYPQTKFKLSGHTDNLGPQEYNMGNGTGFDILEGINYNDYIIQL